METTNGRRKPLPAVRAEAWAESVRRKVRAMREEDQGSKASVGKVRPVEEGRARQATPRARVREEQFAHSVYRFYSFRGPKSHRRVTVKVRTLSQMDVETNKSDHDIEYRVFLDYLKRLTGGNKEFRY